MKQRITYLLPEAVDTGIDRDDLVVRNDSLAFAKAGRAAEEWRVTLGMGEVNDQVRELLQRTHELHLRWVSHGNPAVDALPAPLASRLPPGLHAFFTPRAGAEGHGGVPLCDLLSLVLGAAKGRCRSVAESFSTPRILSGRFAASSTYQYFHYAPLADGIGRVVLGKVCDGAGAEGPALDSCGERWRELELASSVDVDFDAIGHALTLTAVWPARSHRVTRPVRKVRADDRVEVGTLQVQPSDELEELSLGGFLTVIGEDERPSTTMFSFPSRHHPLPPGSRTSYKASFQRPTGLHPKLDITLSRRQLRPPKDSCALHAYWTLPSALFIDRYQFADPLFLAAHNLVSLRSLSGEEDLEAPDWILQRWGSAALLELARPNTTAPGAAAADWTITIPTHLRYLASPHEDSRDQAPLALPWPSVFWACEAEDGLKMANNPFDRVNLGFDGLFGPKTMFFHVPPAEGVQSPVAEVSVPVLDPGSAASVRLGTAVAVTLGFAWVCWRMLRSKTRGGVQAGEGEGKKVR